MNNAEYTEESESESESESEFSESRGELEGETYNEIESNTNYDQRITIDNQEDNDDSVEQVSERSSEEDDGSGEGEQTEDVIEELNINKLSNINIEKSSHSLDDKNIDVIDYRKT